MRVKVGRKTLLRQRRRRFCNALFKAGDVSEQCVRMSSMVCSCTWKETMTYLYVNMIGNASFSHDLTDLTEMPKGD